MDELPYSAWHSFIRAFPKLLKDKFGQQDSRNKQYNIILNNFFSNTGKYCVYFFPTDERDDGEIQADCESFTIWICSQLMAVYLCDRYRGQKENCTQSQIEIVQHCWERNQLIYGKLINCYLTVLKDACDVTGSCKFQWFQLTKYKISVFELPEIEYDINDEKAGDVKDLVLKIVSSQLFNISNFCSTLYSHILECCARLMDRGGSLVYELIGRILDIEHPYVESKFNPFTANVLLHVLKCNPVDLGILLNKLINTPFSKHCFDFSYIRSIILLYMRKRGVLGQDVDEASLNFIRKLLDMSVCDVDDLCKSDEELSPLVMTMVHCLTQKRIKELCNVGSDTLKLEVDEFFKYDKLWNYLRNKFSELICKVDHRSQREMSTILTCFSSYVKFGLKIAYNLYYSYGVNVTPFSEEIKQIANKLISIGKYSSTIVNFKVLVENVTELLLLRESECWEPSVQLSLLFIIFLPWLSTLDVGVYSNVKQSIIQKYAECLNLISTDVKEHCAINLMLLHSTPDDMWRINIVLTCIKEQELHRVIESIPVFLHNLPEGHRTTFVESLVKIGNENVCTHVSNCLRQIVCVFDASVVLTYSVKTGVTFVCTICDNGSKNGIKKQLESDVCKLISHVFCSSNLAKRNVLANLSEFSNHVFISELEIFADICENPFPEDGLTSMAIISALKIMVNVASEAHVRKILEHLQVQSLNSILNSDIEMQYCCISALTDIGGFDTTMLPCINMLLYFVFMAPSMYSSLAKSSIEIISQSHDLEEEHLYLKHKETVFPIIATILIINVNVFNRSIEQCFKRFDHMSVVNVNTYQHLLKYLLPRIVQNPKLHPMLDELAVCLNIDVKNMLQHAFKYVFPHVILFEPAEMAKNVIELVVQQTNISLRELLANCVTKILAHLLVYYDENRANVEKVISDMQSLGNSSTNSNGKPNVKSYIKTRFFGILMCLEAQLSSDCISNTMRTRMLTSLKSIIELMGTEYITSVRYKLLFTLKTILKFENGNLLHLCISLWNSFIRLLERDTLHQLMSNIFVSLLPHINVHKDQINQIFKYLVIENYDIVKLNLCELYFLQPEQCTEDVYVRIQEELAIKMDTSLDNQLEWLLKLAQHELTEVKLYALKRLKVELSVNSKKISQMILLSDSVNNLIFKILGVLIDGFQNEDEKVHLACGECLGEFGAIDLSYIPNSVIKTGDPKYICYQIDDPEFIVNAFIVLCKGWQNAKSPPVMDEFALAIQSFLKIYNITASNDCPIWNRIPAYMKEIILQFFNTTYTLLSNEEVGDIPHLIYNTGRCHSLQSWSFKWSNFLVSLLPDDSKEKQVFTYCIGLVRHENDCMVLFLPNMLLMAILHADEHNRFKIYQEMSSILNRGNCVNGEESSSTQLVVSRELSSIVTQPDSKMEALCLKTVFSLLEKLFMKYYDLRCVQKGKSTDEFVKLESFLTMFSKNQIAEKSFELKKYARCLQYIEEYVSDKGEHLDKYLVFLSRIYGHLNDVDSVRGLFAVHSDKLKQPQHLILLHEVTDQYQDAAICYQQLLKTSDSECILVYEKKMIQCYLEMNQPETALRFVKSLSTFNMNNSKYFYDVECEALWNLSQYEQLEALTSSKMAQCDTNWGICIGKAIVHFMNDQNELLTNDIYCIRNVITKSLHMSSAAFSGYRDCYEQLIKLHILNEFEKITNLVFLMKNTDNVMEDEWHQRFRSVINVEFEDRLKKLQPISRVLHPVLNIRQVLFSTAARLLSSKKPQLVPLFEEEIRKCRLKVIEIANRSRNFQLAYSSIVALDNYQYKGFFIEKAKYFWMKNEQQEALRTLQCGIQYHYPNYSELVTASIATKGEDKKIYSEAMILIGTYNDKMTNADFYTNLEYFKKAVKVYKHSEKALFMLAQYKDKIVNSLSQEDQFRQEIDSYYHIVEYYGKSLEYGCEFIYQSMSRMLNVWLDFGNYYSLDKKSGSSTQLSDRKNIFLKMCKVIDNTIDRLPSFYFFTAFSQILSRIMHMLNECFDRLKMIIVSCILNHPNQALWQFMSLRKVNPTDTSDRLQLERFNKILNDSSLVPLKEIIQKFNDLFEQMTVLCNADAKSPGPTRLTSLHRNASMLLKNGCYDGIIVPVQKFLTIILPRSADGIHKATDTYNPFPENMVSISKIKNEVYVFASLQKPLKITLVGTDGQSYPMIFKSKDDLRIDCRFMEFNSVINMYLKRDVEARDRDLHIRTYTVLPLLNRCGIMEFIPDLLSLRMVTRKMRQSIGLKEVSLDQYRCGVREDLDKKRSIYAALLAKHPPLLQEWYKMEFSNPSSWYNARTSYIRTLAVMSIVGYIAGLGDRHTDNLLLDANNGDVIHVDLNVLFNKGETLEYPERVPFRLTHSMVKAMGPLGYEGNFVFAFEATSRVLRSRKEQLLSVLNTFLYDPLDVAQGRTISRNVAKTNLENVELRLDGCVRCYSKLSHPLSVFTSIPLSVEGQTRRLIEEATNEDNLCQMYVGWSAFV